MLGRLAGKPYPILQLLLGDMYHQKFQGISKLKLVIIFIVNVIGIGHLLLSLKPNICLAGHTVHLECLCS